jgi:hypothetical protein
MGSMKLLSPVLPYVAWLVSSLFTLLDWIAFRELLITVSMRATEIVPFEEQVLSGFLHKWALPAVDGFGVLLCGVAAFALVLAYEPIYTKAREQGILGKRFSQITVVQVTVLIVSGLLSTVLGW